MTKKYPEITFQIQKIFKKCKKRIKAADSTISQETLINFNVPASTYFPVYEHTYVFTLLVLTKQIGMTSDANGSELAQTGQFHPPHTGLIPGTSCKIGGPQATVSSGLIIHWDDSQNSESAILTIRFYHSQKTKLRTKEETQNEV